MGAIGILVLLVAALTGLAVLVCFILVLVEMFKRQATGIAIACIVLFFCSGVGQLIAFVYGWIKAREWNLQKIMMVWTGCLAVNVITLAIAISIWFAATAARMQQLQQQEQRLDHEMQQQVDVEELKIELK